MIYTIIYKIIYTIILIIAQTAVLGGASLPAENTAVAIKIIHKGDSI